MARDRGLALVRVGSSQSAMDQGCAGKVGEVVWTAHSSGGSYPALSDPNDPKSPRYKQQISSGDRMLMVRPVGGAGAPWALLASEVTLLQRAGR